MSALIQSIRVALAYTEDVIADIVTFAEASSNLDALKQAIVARVNNVIASSKVDKKQALKDLKEQVKSALVEQYLAEGKNDKQAKAESERRASDVFLALGFRERAKKKTSDRKKERDEALNPLIEKLVHIAKSEGGDDAVVVLRRAFLSVQAERNS